MGLITKTMQSRHRETLSPWLKDFVEAASTTPLPLIPQKLNEFPTRWPFPRGDLYHWIPLLNRFDSILEAFCATYNLSDGPQTRDFTCELLLKPAESPDNDKAWDMDRLTQLGYKKDGDCQLVIAILEFSQMLLMHCGNRSIYASSSRLNDLLHSTYLSLLKATLEVGLELAQRYHASMKRMGQATRQVSTALLANHYNIELDRVNLLAQPFVKTPLAPFPPFSDVPPTTPGASSSKTKDKASIPGQNVASMYANDLVSLVAPTPTTEGGWNGWGDLKVVYYPRTEGTATPTAPEVQTGDRGFSTIPATPTPLRRSSTAISQSSRSNRVTDDSPSARNTGGDEHVVSGPKSVEIRQTTVQSSSIYELLTHCPADIPKTSRYEFLNRLRICKALVGFAEERQQALAVRLLAIANLVYIQPELTFVEKVLKADNDEPRRYQLIYQLAELIHPSANGMVDTPLSLQAIAFNTLQGITSIIGSKYSDIISALNANVNHGILMYVVRKAVATMKEDSSEPDDGKMTELDRWRASLFSLTLHIMIANRVGPDLTSNGIIEILVDILKIRSKTAEVNWSMVVAFLDTLVYQYPPSAFEAFNNASGLETMADLIVHVMSSSKELAAKGQGTKPEFHAQLVDYAIPFHHQQTAKWLLKFIHHLLQGQHHFGANVDRALRNLVDNSGLLASLRAVMEDMRIFGSVVWTNAATLLSDFINNDPTSFAAISESGMIQSFLTALTGEVVTLPPAEGTGSDENAEDAQSPAHSEDSMSLDADQSHPPTQDVAEKLSTHPPAHGILATTDAISIIPPVLNSISLNRAGRKMVVSSRSFHHFLGIFLSPEHVQVMAKSDPDLPSNLGSSFDELARHHPELISTIQDAVFEITKRVLQLANTKSETEGWGAKLLIADPTGKSVPADDSLLTRTGDSVPIVKGKDKITNDDLDIEMLDAAPTGFQVSEFGKDSKPDTEHDPQKEITPYIWSLGSFLGVLFGNNNHLKNNFIREGGIEVLLDLSESPSLPVHFESTVAPRMLTQVISLLIESCPVLGITSVVNRIDNALQDLQPLLAREGVEYPFFAPFIVPGLSLLDEKGEWDLPVVRKVAKGTKVVKALVRLHSLVKTLYQSFPFAPRNSSTTVPNCNAYDLYERLIKQLGPLLRDLISEDLSIATLVPQHWSRKQVGPDGSDMSSIPAHTAANLASGSDTPAVIPQSEVAETSTVLKKPTPEEQSTIQFKNYEAIHGLLHSTMPSILPFFQTLGKSLLPRRVEAYPRSRHYRMADALVDTILDQLKVSQDKLGAKEFQHWIMMFHGLHEMLIDMSRQAERPAGTQLILPVLIAFKEHNGIKVLNDMLEKFAKDIFDVSANGEDSLKVRQASVGMKKILELYYLLANGKNVSESIGHTSLLAPRPGSERERERERINRDNRDAGNQLVVELRLAIFPVMRKLWESNLAEKAPTAVLSKVIDILQIIAAADHEAGAHRKSDKTVPPTFARNLEHVPFPWASYANALNNLVRLGYDEDLSREAVYRANGRAEDAETYCRAFSEKSEGKRLAFRRNAIPEEDAYPPPPPPDPKPEPSPTNQTPVIPTPNPLSAEPMALDPAQNIVGDAIGEAILEDLGDNSSDESNDTSNESSSQHSDSREASAAPTQQAAASSAPATDSAAAASTARDDLDKERAALSNDLIDRCLDVIQAHPDLVFEISDLIQNMILKSNNEEKRTEVGETLANALMSLSSAMDDENDKKENGDSIAAYAHLLSLLLQDRSFFKSTLPTLKQNIGDYLGFLKLSPAAFNDELPPWMSYILLMFETLLIDEEQPVEVKWTPPLKHDDPVQQPIWSTKEPTLSEDDRAALLAAILDILPRIGKEESLAVSVLRILVILTRDHAVAKKVGEKLNLQRLFVMAKQLCSGGSSRLNRSHISDHILTILRHIVEDEEILRQTIQTKIRQFMAEPPRSTRNFDIPTYLKSLSSVVLRSPKLFVEVTTQVVKLTRWTFPSVPNEISRSYTLALKPTSEEEATPKDGSVEPTVQATEDLTINDVKPSTESKDKEMPDPPKIPHELKRPVLENPDGVVHFLLCELLNYRDVDDKETPSPPLKESKPQGEASAAEEDATPAPAEEEVPDQKKDEKKTAKATFKSEDNPIFVYRCFLLSCLAELLESYTRAKVEFINFKRSAPMQTNTPIKPRSSVLNYLLNDLLCYTQSNSASELVGVKKKAAVSSHAQNVLVALVSFTGEKFSEHGRSSFEYDDDPDLLFVRRFVLDTVLRAYKEASALGEAFDVRYPRMLCLAELMSQMIGDGDAKDPPVRASQESASGISRSQRQLTRLMYEKGYLAALTASISDVDLTFPDVKRTIKHILRVLKVLTKTAFQLSQTDFISTTTTDQPEDDFASSSSLSDLDDDREETPDLYRNSTLGMLEPGREDDYYSAEEEDDDDEMYDEEVYEDELDYGEEMSQDEEDNPSDEEELGEMGSIEGLPGEPDVVEVMMGEDDDEDEDMDEDDDGELSDEDDEDEMDSEDMEDIEDRIEIMDEEGNAIDDDGNSGWESDTDEEDEEDEEELDYGAEAQGLQGAQATQTVQSAHAQQAQRARNELNSLQQFLGLAHGQDLDADDLDGEEDDEFDEPVFNDYEVGEEEDEDAEDEEIEEEEEDEMYYDPSRPPQMIMHGMPAGMGFDLSLDQLNRLRGHNVLRSPYPPAPFAMGGYRDPLGAGRSPFAPRRRDLILDTEAQFPEEPFPEDMIRFMGELAMANRRMMRRHADITPPTDFRSYIRQNPRESAMEDNRNPLLLPSSRPGRDSSPRVTSQQLIRLGIPNSFMANSLDGHLGFISDLMHTMPAPRPGGPALSLQLTQEGPHGEIRQVNIPLGSLTGNRDGRWETRREVYQEPIQAVQFNQLNTSQRWGAESKLLFGNQHFDKANMYFNAVLAALAPAAIQHAKEVKAGEEEERRKQEDERKAREEEERKAREAKEAEEKAAREKKEAEERERQERERAEAEAVRAAELVEAASEPASEQPQAMEGVVSHEAAANEQQEQPTASDRILTTIRNGETVDVTDLGIDPEYLAALPEEFREEVIAQTVSTRRSQAREQAAVEGENTEVFQEFLEALPAELRAEIVQQERQERRRRERDDQRRQAISVGQSVEASEMDPASILLTFPPALREQVLMEQGEDLMQHLPPELAAEARALAQRMNAHHRAPPPAARTPRPAVEVSGVGAIDKIQRRTVVQMLDKAGVATLLRLMFITQQGSIRNYLFDVFSPVCENRQNRLEVVSTLLQILQDGSTDMDAVERSFGQLSLRARQPKEKDVSKTPQNLKRTFTNISTHNHITSNSEVSPLLIVQQCLDLLQDLASKNPHIPSLFLTEHETVASTLKRSLSRKGKGKDVNTKAQKYAINSLLGLLDRPLVMQSAQVMQLLADLLNKVTYPLQALERRRKEAEEEAKRQAEEKDKGKKPADNAEPAPESSNANPSGDSSAQDATQQPVETPATTSAADQPAVQEGTQAQEVPAEEASGGAMEARAAKPEEKKIRQLTPPTIPDHNLKLVVNIFVARECSSKTFQNTISTIKNLSNIPGAKNVFGEELVRQARELSENIVVDLNELLPHILKAESGTEIQGVALAKFSPGASEQNKLLRVLTALDHLFDSKSKKSDASTGAKDNTKEDLLGSLYWNSTFITMWDKLSACLSVIRQRENMLNVATILLPLIESLMVVCKNTTLTDTSNPQGTSGKEMLLSSPPPENRIAGLFFTFTEDHRRILNELVRHNPKLMSGTFSLLVKNPKVLEFDNKRNWFNRNVHSKTGQQERRSTNYPSLQLSVRREHVFHDSFKALYFKSGEEMKYGKLSVRFHGEEGVDAGGVTREWFQALSRQMFDPNYALFIPVSSDRTTFHPNKLSSINEEHLLFFKFIGRVIGKALFEGRLLDCYFSRAVYKRILGKPVSVKDMESFDPDYYKSLAWMLDNDITDILVETFSVEDDEFGVTKVVDLIENGRNVPVTEENKHEYVRLIVEHKLLTSVKDQMENFLKGFHEIIPEELIAIFNEQELELLISGLPDIDVDDWKSNTEYHNYTAASQQIQWFWRAVRSFDKEEQAKLLQFVTGTSKVPLNGFKELEGMNGVSRFNIHRDYGNKERLPSSHTCFNQLDLPEYESYEMLRKQVLQAITAGSDYFGFA